MSLALRGKPRQPMQETDAGEITPETGLVGDYRGAPGKRQVTILFAQDWAAACAALGETCAWTIRRANLLVEGVANPREAGGLIEIGQALLLITGETDPCSRMDAQWPGLRDALTPDWRGGVTARVVRGGAIRAGDQARLVLQNTDEALRRQSG